MSKRFGYFLFIVTFAVVAVACGPRFIPNTEIPDTEENRDIVDFCERYRRAVEDINLGLLMTMASPRYFDNCGTTTGDDDMDRAGLEENLKQTFQSVEEIRHEIRYRDIFVKDGIIHVEYTFTTSFQFTVEGETKWSNKTADNRLELERVDDGFLIISGM